MLKKIFALLLLSCAASISSAQSVPAGFDLSNYGVRIEPDKRLIMVLATLEMARSLDPQTKDAKLINTPLTEKGVAFREKLANDNSNIPDDLRRRISIFVTQYKKRNPTRTEAEIVSPFIAMAYALTPAPELADPVITSDLPGDLLDVLDFAPLVREVYRRTTISSKLDEYVKEYRSDSDNALRGSTKEMVSEILNYLHTRPTLVYRERVTVQTRQSGSKKNLIEKTEIRDNDRTFFIVPEKLAPKGNINFLNIRDDYYVIVPPDADVSFSEARRAFLRFVVDPLVLGNQKDLVLMREWTKSQLADLRKADSNVSPDTLLSVSRSLVAAIDVRQTEFAQIRLATDQARQKIAGMKTDAEKRAVTADLEKFKQALSDEATLQLYEDYQKGAVLSFYFAEQLKGVEDSGFDIAASLKDIILSFEPTKETNRIAATAEARKRAHAAREERKKHPETRTAANPVTERLIEIDKIISTKNYAKAGAELDLLKQQYPAEPRIYYQIGRVAGLTAAGMPDSDAQAVKLLEAKTALTNVLSTATDKTDKALLSLTYVALGRIYESQGENGMALKLYDKAIEFGDIPNSGFREAIAAKQQLLKP
jgi:tetratricopeptide (TPR) repeat protein